MLLVHFLAWHYLRCAPRYSIEVFFLFSFFIFHRRPCRWRGVDFWHSDLGKESCQAAASEESIVSFRLFLLRLLLFLLSSRLVIYLTCTSVIPGYVLSTFINVNLHYCFLKITIFNICNILFCACLHWEKNVSVISTKHTKMHSGYTKQNF